MIKMDKKYIKNASLMLSRAFKDDPIDEYIFPDPEERKIKIPLVYELLLKSNFSNSRTYISSSRIEGIAVWIKSGNLESSFWKILASGNVFLAMKIGWRAIRKIQEFDRFFHQKHKELAPSEHWYLAILAVDPKYQGRRLASKLMDGMFIESDLEGLPYFVETEGKKNVSIYEHFGFKVIGEYVASQTNETLVAMLRRPRLPEMKITQRS